MYRTLELKADKNSLALCILKNTKISLAYKFRIRTCMPEGPLDVKKNALEIVTNTYFIYDHILDLIVLN